MLLYRLQWTISSHAEHCQTRRVAPIKENDSRVVWTKIKDRRAEKRNLTASRHYDKQYVCNEKDKKNIEILSSILDIGVIDSDGNLL